jgi:hypothetical protein
MAEHFLFKASAIIMSATLLLYIPIWAIALNRNKLKIFDFICPFIPISVWLIMTAAGIGQQTHANLIEIPLIMIITFLGCAHMMFSPYDRIRTLKGKLLVLTIVTIIASLLRLYLHISDQ